MLAEELNALGVALMLVGMVKCILKILKYPLLRRNLVELLITEGVSNLAMLEAIVVVEHRLVLLLGNLVIMVSRRLGGDGPHDVGQQRGQN